MLCYVMLCYVILYYIVYYIKYTFVYSVMMHPEPLKRILGHSVCRIEGSVSPCPLLRAIARMLTLRSVDTRDMGFINHPKPQT